jgi:DHA2 family multidrug resistance protein
VETATFVGIPVRMITDQKGPFSQEAMATIDPLLQTAATVQALNQAWLLMAALTVCAILCVPLARRVEAVESTLRGKT